MRRSLSLGSLGMLASLAIAAPAGAIVIPECPGAATATIPVNGWVPLAAVYEGLVASNRGTPVHGELVMVEQHPYWRPLEPFVGGERLEFDADGCGFGIIQDFSVRVEGRSIPGSIDIVPGLELVLDSQRPSATTHCEVDRQLLLQAGFCEDAADGCEPWPEPYEVVTGLHEAWRSTVALVDPSRISQTGQLLVRRTQWFGSEVDEGWLMLREHLPYPQGNVTPTNEPLCSSFELLVVPTDERRELTRCVDPPEELLRAQPVVPRFARSRWMEHCTLPPEGLLEAWCDEYHDECVTHADSERARTLCSNHYALCGTEPMAGPGVGEPGWGEPGGAGPDGATRDDPPATPVPECPGVEPSTSGSCSFLSGTSSQGLSGFGWLAVWGWVWHARRRTPR